MEVKINSLKFGPQIVLIDDDDSDLIGTGFHLSKAGQFLYVKMNKDGSLLHRAVTKCPSGLVVDHVNRNTLDNRKQNLRICTIQENLRNQKRPNNKTGVTGVSIGHKGKYNAQIKHNYKKIHLGTFDSISEASKARKLAEEKYWNT